MPRGRARRAVAAIMLSAGLAGGLAGVAPASAAPALSTAGGHLASRPLHTAAPKITGAAVVGSTLAVRPGRWTSGTRFRYQWLAAGRPIPGATHSSLVLHAAQKGKRVSVRVTGTRAGYAAASRTSAATAAVRAATVSAPLPTRRPTAPAVPPNPGNSVNCPDFATHDEAQAWFDRYYPYYGDVARLDADHDGIACEDLP